MTSGKQSSQPRPDYNKEKRINTYYSPPPNEVSQPDDIERNPNKKQEAYDGAIEKLQSLSKENIYKIASFTFSCNVMNAIQSYDC